MCSLHVGMSSCKVHCASYLKYIFKHCPSHLLVCVFFFVVLCFLTRNSCTQTEQQYFQLVVRASDLHLNSQKSVTYKQVKEFIEADLIKCPCISVTVALGHHCVFIKDIFLNRTEHRDTVRNGNKDEQTSFCARIHSKVNLGDLKLHDSC